MMLTMTDALPESFDDLDYPGRTKPKNRVKKPKAAPKAESSSEWDFKPVYYMVGDEKREFFTISHLAKALGYSVQSIRAWEAQGLMPRTPYRSPRTRAPVAGGRSNKGRRLWTREQIQGIIKIAKKHKVILNREPPTAAFAREVAEFFSASAPVAS